MIEREDNIGVCVGCVHESDRMDFWEICAEKRVCRRGYDYLKGVAISAAAARKDLPHAISSDVKDK